MNIKKYNVKGMSPSEIFEMVLKELNETKETVEYYERKKEERITMEKFDKLFIELGKKTSEKKLFEYTSREVTIETDYEDWVKKSIDRNSIPDEMSLNDIFKVLDTQMRERFEKKLDLAQTKKFEEDKEKFESQMEKAEKKLLKDLKEKYE